MTISGLNSAMIPSNISLVPTRRVFRGMPGFRICMLMISASVESGSRIRIFFSSDI